MSQKRLKLWVPSNARKNGCLAGAWETHQLSIIFRETGGQLKHGWQSLDPPSMIYNFQVIYGTNMGRIVKVKFYALGSFRFLLVWAFSPVWALVDLRGRVLYFLCSVILYFLSCQVNNWPEGNRGHGISRFYNIFQEFFYSSIFFEAFIEFYIFEQVFLLVCPVLGHG